MLKAPQYTGTRPAGIALAVESMKRHTTDEGWQIMAGLESAGYKLTGHDIGAGNLHSQTHVPRILQKMPQDTGVVVLQDKREWDVKHGDFRDPEARFTGVEALADRPDLFKLTVLKDAHSRPEYHQQSAEEIGCHGWIVYYDKEIVHRLAPFTRPQHLIRTYHSVDSGIIPIYDADRQGCLLSGAISNAYPLRTKLFHMSRYLPETVVHKHPGYHRNGSHTPLFLQYLSTFKVAICTASEYQYALRKIIEATACGCVVLTNLKENLPLIDGNLVRLQSDDISIWAREIKRRINVYDPVKQRGYAALAQEWYDYRAVGKRLADDIEALRSSYNADVK